MATISGGEKLAAAMRAMAMNIGSNPSTLRVGFLSNSKYPDGTPVAMIAAIQDFGAPRAGIPPRPFFRNMIAAKSKEWPEAVAIQLQANGYDAKRTLDAVGAAIAGQLRQSITDTNSPPLKPATIARKGGTRGMKYNAKDPSTFAAKPLIDTGYMFNSVDHLVVEG